MFTSTLVAGVPLMVGASLVLVTVRLKAGRAVVTVPSLTLITMLLVVPTLALVGVPLKRPVVVLKVAQLGRFTMLKAKVVPASGSDAVGVKL